MVLVGYDRGQHHSFRDFDDCEELRYLTLLVPLKGLHDHDKVFYFFFLGGGCSTNSIPINSIEPPHDICI